MKNYFNFTKRQKIGIITISIIIVLQIVLLNLNQIRIIPNPILVDDNQYNIITHTEDKVDKNNYYNKKSSNKKYNYKPFDPNSFTKKQWVNIGFTTKQAEIIVKYKNKIKGFKSKEDVKKVYVISDQKFKEIESFLVFKKTNSTFKNQSEFKQKDTLKNSPVLYIKAEINSATQEQLESIVGIGEYTALNIIKQRDALGGYYSLEQLNEVKGIYEDNLKLIKQQLSVNSNLITKIEVNQMSIPKLKKHPYISWDVAQAITNERLKGKLFDLQFLVDQKKLLTQKELENLLPYIKF